MAELILIVLQVLGTVQWAPAHKKPETIVFNSADQMAQVWEADGGKKEALPQNYNEVGEIKVYDEKPKKKKGAKPAPPTLPSIDFSKQTVLAVFAGEKPSAGYEVKIEHIAQARAKRTTWVVYSEKAPGKGAAPAEGMTYPSHVVVVKKIEGNVTFVKADSAEAKEVVEALKSQGKLK